MENKCEAEQESSLGCIALVCTKWVVFVCVGVEGQSVVFSPHQLSWTIFGHARFCDHGGKVDPRVP